MAYIDDKLGRGEKIVHQGHQHIIVVAVKSIKWVGLFVVAFIAALWILTTNPTEEWQKTAKTVVELALALTCLIAFVKLFIDYLVWQAEEYLVTNERVIKIWGIINKNLSDSSLDKVNDVEMYQSMFGRLWGYGTIKILTGNETGANEYDYISKPNDFKKAMLDAKNGFFGDASDVALQERTMRTQPQPMPIPPQPRFYEERGAAVPRQQAQPPNYGYQNQPQPKAAPANPSQADIPTLITQLAILRDQGVLSEAEFQEKKNDLLRRM
ncbi:PH domain-containing protein [Candidatus Chlorohelix sp.]|uniref:PH domain-containing protein n=1 Tax=Candidatus Chlorohelix sp. TaxID=3139201 RepID=UPI00302BC09A